MATASVVEQLTLKNEVNHRSVLKITQHLYTYVYVLYTLVIAISVLGMSHYAILTLRLLNVSAPIKLKNPFLATLRTVIIPFQILLLI